MESAAKLTLCFHLDETNSINYVDISYSDAIENMDAPVPDDFTSLVRTTLLDFLLKLETSHICYKTTDADVSYVE